MWHVARMAVLTVVGIGLMAVGTSQVDPVLIATGAGLLAAVARSGSKNDGSNGQQGGGGVNRIEEHV